MSLIVGEPRERERERERDQETERDTTETETARRSVAGQTNANAINGILC